MADKKNAGVSLPPCQCGEVKPLQVKLRTGLWIVACRGCPTHVYGATAEEAAENWVKEVEPRGSARKRN